MSRSPVRARHLSRLKELQVHLKLLVRSKQIQAGTLIARSGASIPSGMQIGQEGGRVLVATGRILVQQLLHDLLQRRGRLRP